jgi:putative glutamine amidotransferase
MAPTIAILIGRDPATRYSLHRGYVDAVWAAGAIPIVLAPPPAGALLERFVEIIGRCDGLLLSGGGDVDPTVYGEPPTADLMSIDGARDRAELVATRETLEAGRPILGICRGIQLLAAAHGGALHQDLVSAGFTGHHWAEDRQSEPVHAVDVTARTAAADALAGHRTVNSIHHQAVKDPGSLTPTAWSDDGVVEAIEGDKVLGLQWHPERLRERDARHLAPFEWLVSAAA